MVLFDNITDGNKEYLKKLNGFKIHIKQYRWDVYTNE